MAENTPDQLRTDMLKLGAAARSAATILSKTSSNTKNKALMAAAEEIRKHQAIILQANRTDMEANQNLDFSKSISKKSLGPGFANLFEISFWSKCKIFIA